MAVITETFEYKGAKITVQRPNGFSQARYWRLRDILKTSAPNLDARDVEEFLYCLANTVSVDGSLGFPVPVSGAVASDMLLFIQGLGESDAELLWMWDDAIKTARKASNDPDLLPPEELSQKKETTPA
jgi:hypothetical protein